HLGRAPALPAAVRSVEKMLLLVQGVVVVDDHDGVDPEAGGGLELRQMVVEPAIPAEPDHGSFGQRALRPERRREGPAERAGATKKPLSRPREPEHLAGPHAGVTGVREYEAVLGQPLGDPLADALGPDRNRVGAAQLIRFVKIVADELARALEPAAPPRRR